MCATPPGTGDVPKNREIEYGELAETYRQGVRTLFDMFKFYMLFQAGLGTIAGVFFSRPELQASALQFYGVRINFPLLIVSLIGVSAGIGAPYIARRMYRYHDSLVERARFIEHALDMQLLTGLGAVWREGSSYRSATAVAFTLFSLVAILWLFGIANSFAWIA